MASRILKQSCCGRGKRKPVARDFCSNLRLSSGVTLAHNAGSWSLLLNVNGQKKDLATSLRTHSCASNTAGMQLARVVIAALASALAQGKGPQLMAKANRQMPLIQLKDFLFKVAGPCSSCRGKGCAACNKLGVL